MVWDEKYFVLLLAAASLLFSIIRVEVKQGY